MRFFTMGAAERRQKIKEFFAGAGTESITTDGVTWQVDGSFSDGVINVSYSATPTDSSTWITGAWVFLNNGTGDDAPSLGCSAAVTDGLQGTSAASNFTGASYYVPLGPLQPVVVATIIAQLNNNTQSQIAIEIQTSSATK
jgi:hypothetical protein